LAFAAKRESCAPAPFWKYATKPHGTQYAPCENEPAIPIEPPLGFLCDVEELVDQVVQSIGEPAIAIHGQVGCGLVVVYASAA